MITWDETMGNVSFARLETHRVLRSVWAARRERHLLQLSAPYPFDPGRFRHQVTFSSPFRLENEWFYTTVQRGRYRTKTELPGGTFGF